MVILDEGEIPGEPTRAEIPNAKRVKRLAEEQEAKEQLARQVSAKTMLDLRTVKKYLEGGRVLASTRKTIADAIKNL